MEEENMNYIYDILINLKPQLYDFFEWNQEDEISHIRKIPLWKVSTKTLQMMKQSIFQVKAEFLKKIECKTETFSNKKGSSIQYACLFCDSYEAIVFKWNEKGILVSKSHLLVDEEAEVLEIASLMEVYDIEIAIIKKAEKLPFYTREEIEIEKYLRKEVEKLEKEKQVDKLKYLYYECFNEREEDIGKVAKEIYQVLKNHGEKIFDKMEAFFHLTSIKQ